MADYISQGFRLRAGTPMPISGGDFVIHSFMAASQISNVIPCTDVVLKTSAFLGQGGLYTSASYSRLPVSAGEQGIFKSIFKAKESKKETFVEERSYND